MNAMNAIIMSLLVIALSGCASSAHIDKVETSGKVSFGAIRKQVEEQKQTPGKEEDSAVVYHNNPIVTLKAIRTKLDHTQRDGWCRFRKLATAEPVSLMEFAQLITRWCQIPVQVTQDAVSLLEGSQQTAVQQNMPIIPGGAPQNPAATGRTTTSNGMVDISYSGDVEGLLNVVTARLGLSWKKVDRSFLIYNVDAETFYLNSIALENSVSADSTTGITTTNGVSSGSTSSGGTGTGVGGSTGSMQTAKVSIKTAIWSDIQKTLQILKSKRGECNTSPSTGSITCVDTGNSLRKIKGYITTENKNLSKQVLFNVRVLSVSLKNNNSFGFSWNAVWQSMSSKYGIKLVNTFAGATGGMTGTFSVLQNVNSPFGGTDAVLNALSEFGTVSIVKEPSVATMNLQVVPIQVGKVDSYVPGSTTVSTPNVGSQTSLQIGTVTTGFSMTLLPYVMPDMDNQMLLHFSLSLSNFDGVRKITQGTAYAEAPMVSIPINSVQQIRLKPGETLMLTGFDQNDSSTTRQGTFSPDNLFLGGNKGGTETRSTLAVLITPVILD